MKKRGFSEYVSLGHPDKVADYISEYILDRYIERDPFVRYAVEVQIKDNFVTLGGEVTSKCRFSDAEIKEFVREAVREIGYTPEYQAVWGRENTLSCDDLNVAIHISSQSPDIAQGVDIGGWGDQGIFFGMAVDSRDTNDLPLDVFLARAVGKAIYESGIEGVGLDVKTQVSVADDEVTTLIVAAPLAGGISRQADLLRKIGDVFEYQKVGRFVLNGTGAFIRHASMGDCGTTGRKLAVDFYGGNCNVGGGSPWTKDPSKADLTLNLYARKLALDFVHQNGVPYCKCGISCCIGKRDIEVFMEDEAGNVMDFLTQKRPAGDIIEELGLRRPIYAKMCREGLLYV